MRIATAVLLLLLGTCVEAQPRPDSCRAQIPRTLVDALARAFPGYRAPLETDNAPEDIKYSQEHGGTGCLGVGIADFTGDGKRDYLVGLTALKGSSGLAVIALPKRGGWRFQEIHSWSEGSRFRQYVDVAPPGKHDRTAAATGPLGPGETTSMDCPNWGALVGTVEATGVVYCYVGGRWLHVWTSS